MKQGDYQAEKEAKKNSTKQGIIVLVIFIAIFMAVIFRVANRSLSKEDFFALMPSSGEAYKVSKDFIKPMLKSTDDADFSEEDFQCTKNLDSVYIIRSYFSAKDLDGKNVKTKFVITLKYNGGSSENDQNWTLVNLREHK